MDDSYTAHIYSQPELQNEPQSLSQPHRSIYDGWYSVTHKANGQVITEPLTEHYFKGDDTPHWACGKVVCDCDEQYEQATDNWEDL